jgi:hypothetical protein
LVNALRKALERVRDEMRAQLAADRENHAKLPRTTSLWVGRLESG